MKTKLILAGALAFAGIQGMNAQNASEYNNNALIGGTNNSAFGADAMLYSGSLGTPQYNSAVGWHALQFNEGDFNTATGANSMYDNAGFGSYNTANGNSSLYHNYGNYNTAIGNAVLYNNGLGNNNTGVGDSSLYNNNSDNNTAVGKASLFNNTSGIDNTANGYRSLFNNTSGHSNTAIGHLSLYSNTSGASNTASGYGTLSANTTGFANTATGVGSLASNTTGRYNTAHGNEALAFNTTGIDNTAVGYMSLTANSIGDRNSAFGFEACLNTSGSNNSAFGHGSLGSNTSGAVNTAIGNIALSVNNTGNGNTAIGNAANTSTTNLINSTALGNGAIVNASNKIRFGNAAVTVVEGPVAYTTSDGRFKTNVKTDDVKGLEFIKKLRPVVYNFDTKKFTEFLTKNMDAEMKKNYMNEDFKPSTAIRQSGFIAQEVEQAAKETGYDFNGVHKPNDENDNYTLAYSQFVVPLVKAVQEQQQMIEEQNKTIAELKAQVERSNQPAVGSVHSATSGINSLGTIRGFNMEQNVPNPFTHETVIKYTLPQQVNNAYMAVYDLSGKQITTFPVSQKTTSLTVTADKLAPGIYIYSIVADGSILDSKRMVVADK